MPNLNYTLVQEGDNQNITVYRVPDFDHPFQANSSHAQWSDILTGVLADDVAVLDLFNIANTLKRQLVSERLQVANGRLYFDGDEVDDGLSQFVVEMIADGNPDYPAFVNFTEKLYSNPQQHSREHLFNYLYLRRISIVPNGDMLLYKTLRINSGEFKDQKPYTSGSAGPANVSGYEHKQGLVPQAIGDVVTMPRSETWKDPSVSCSTGLHVAAWGYWGNYGVHTAVLVNPRDVVSVPHDDSKIRCCRYKIVTLVTEPFKGTVISDLKVPEIPEFNLAPEAPASASKPAKSTDKASVGFATGSSQQGSQQPTAKVKHPSKMEFETAKMKARAQKKGLKNYIGKRWTLIGGDGSNRKDWSKS
jgi:hypothetical protein